MIAHPADAAEASGADDDVPDILVTAQRVSSSLQKTPVAVGVLDDQAIQDRNTSQVRDLSGLVAGLFIPKTASVSVQPIYIRGIGTAAPIYNAAVAMYVDDVYIPRIVNSAVFGSPDLERIEVLRGPQGTLYGQNSSAGAIKVISKDPSDEAQGWASISAGSYKAFEGKAYYTGPIVPGLLSFGLAYQHQENEGFVENRFLNRHVGRLNLDQVRAKLKFTPAPGVSFVLAGEYLSDTSDNASGTPVSYPGTGPRITFDDRLLRQHDNSYGVSLRSDFDLTPQLKLRSITGYRWFRNDPNTWSNSGVPGDVSGFQLNIDDRQLSQEFQLLGSFGRLDLTAGIIGTREHYNVDRPSWAARVYRGIETTTIVTSAAVYGQAHYKLTDTLGVTAGIRYNAQKDTYDWEGYDTDALLNRTAITGTLTNLMQKTDGVVPKIGIDFEPVRGVFTYASITKGTKAGGYNPVPATIAVAAIPVNPEKVTTYEAGTKLNLFGGRLRSNIALFYNDFSNYQAVVNNPIVNGVPLNISVVVNAGKAKTYGFEFENVARLAPGLDWRLAVTMLRTRFVEFLNPTGAASTNFKGNQLNRSPHLTVGSGVNYAIPLQIPGQLRVNGDVSYSSLSYDDIANLVRIPRNTDVSGGAFYTTGNKRWTLSLTARNLLDNTFIISQAKTPSVGANIVTYNPPRTVMAGLRYDF